MLMDDFTSTQSRIFRRREIIYSEDKDFLGSGGFGVVYRCRLADSRHREAAVKVLNMPRRLGNTDEGAFLREANILGRIDCPSIVRFLGLCIDPGHYAIVMEHVQYGDLEKMLLSTDVLQRIQFSHHRIRIAQEIAKGMNYLHSLQPPIIHRDLKTANVLVGSGYCCKIIDFGLARVRDISQRTTGSVQGTVAYTAPEVFSGTVERNKEMKVDVYSYAMILWQMNEMKQIYAGVSPTVIRVNVLAGQRPLLSDDSCRQEFRDIIERCWDGQPDSRLHFREIVTMLDGIMRQIERSLEGMYSRSITGSVTQRDLDFDLFVETL
ncbi:dual specificity protein kinase shkC-like [Corticium candelabrum]|uniref:dual specificity protein kinase shkC-like n=1 Tax=Corticium candelabrum TaxID=121492 RepID=UPI002E274404|nr:dual specificity protein kinase shkC-like [Corticium candelabrum]